MIVFADSLPLSVCLDFSPSHGGVYRAAVDFAQAVQSPILSFSDGTGSLPPESLPVPLSLVDVRKASVWHRHISLSSSAVTSAEQAAGRPKAIFCHSLFRSHNAWVQSFSKKRSIPYLAIPHGSLDPWVFSRRRLARAAWMKAVGEPYLRNASAIVYATHSEQMKAESVLGFKPRSAVIPWPVDVPSTAPSEAMRKAARDRLGLPNDTRLMVYLGRYHSMKRPIETVQLFLRAKRDDCILIMAGFDGDLTAAQLRQQFSAVIPRSLRIMGPVFGEDRRDLLTAADCFVSWSHRENFCYAAAEALAASCPVILSVGNDLSGELRNYDCGWFLSDDDQGSLNKAFTAFATASEFSLRTMGESGRRFVETQLSRKTFAAAVQSLE